MITGSKWLNYCTGEYKGLEDKYGNPSPYFRKTFTVEKKLEKATLLIAALGVFKVYVNGQEVMGDYLSPGWTDYRKQIPLIEYDITHLLQEKNAIGVVLGDGWAVGHIGSTTTFKRTSWSDMIEFVADIRLAYEDGTKAKREITNQPFGYDTLTDILRRMIPMQDSAMPMILREYDEDEE